MSFETQMDNQKHGLSVKPHKPAALHVSNVFATSNPTRGPYITCSEHRPLWSKWLAKPTKWLASRNARRGRVMPPKFTPTPETSQSARAQATFASQKSRCLGLGLGLRAWGGVRYTECGTSKTQTLPGRAGISKGGVALWAGTMGGGDAAHDEPGALSEMRGSFNPMGRHSHIVVAIQAVDSALLMLIIPSEIGLKAMASVALSYDLGLISGVVKGRRSEQENKYGRAGFQLRNIQGGTLGCLPDQKPDAVAQDRMYNKLSVHLDLILMIK
ncbi:hypothetical protein K438DRAFT_1765264 [Mycena galopus ATCC 62051]|nr:hypothetical protein K438DRAFT_1765264 [Mycena galopus ATCC 62051]